MKYFITYFVLGVLACSTTRSQVLINPQLPTPGIFTKPQLWNIGLVNSSGEPLTVRIQVVISDRNTNQPILSALTRFIRLENGARQISYADISPVTYQIGNSAYQIDNSPNGFLPVGIFNVCYSIKFPHQDGLEVLAEECQTIEVEPMSPPQLIIPADNERISNNKPTFTWTPPLPFQFFTRLSYEFALVEVASYQTAAEALQTNTPIFRKTGVQQTQLQYPETGTTLDSGKIYAWRVMASNNAIPIASSEVWTFKIGTENKFIQSKQGNNSFIELSDNEQSALALVTGMVQFTFDNRDNNAALKINFKELSSTGEKQIPIDNNIIPLKYGQNNLQFDLRKFKSFKQKANYLMEVEAGTKKMFLKFQFR
jgi:hypothetical protein